MTTNEARLVLKTAGRIGERTGAGGLYASADVSLKVPREVADAIRFGEKVTITVTIGEEEAAT